MNLRTKWCDVLDYFWPATRSERLDERIRRHDVELHERRARLLKRRAVIEALRDRWEACRRENRDGSALRAELDRQEAKYARQVAVFEQFNAQRAELIRRRDELAAS